MTNPAAKEEPRFTRLPTCIFALNSNNNNDALIKDLSDVGIGAQFVSGEEELFKVQSQSHCFASFVNLDLYPKLVTWCSDRSQKMMWIAVSTPLNKMQTAKLYSQGMTDVLTTPVHPFTYKSRARQLLARFVARHGMPADVQLPTGMIRPPEKFPPAWGGIIAKISSGVTTTSHSTPDTAKTAAQSRPTVQLRNGSGSFGNHQAPRERLEYLDSAARTLAKLNKLFQEVSPDSKRTLLLNESFARKRPAILWSQQQKWKRRLDVISFNKESNSLILGHGDRSSHNEFIEEFKNLGPDTVFFLCLNLERARIFSALQNQKSQIEAEGLRVQLSGELFETQRRSHFRLHWQDSRDRIQVSAQFPKPAEFVASNISAHGIQLLLSNHDPLKFKKGQLLTGVKFKVYDQLIECSAVVRWTQHDRMGLQFLYLPEESEMGLQLYVMEESYTYLKAHVQPDK